MRRIAFVVCCLAFVGCESKPVEKSVVMKEKPVVTELDILKEHFPNKKSENFVSCPPTDISTMENKIMQRAMQKVTLKKIKDENDKKISE